VVSKTVWMQFDARSIDCHFIATNCDYVASATVAIVVIGVACN